MTRYVEKRRGTFGVEPVCRVLGVAVSTHYARRSRKPSRRELRDRELITEIQAARAGYRRVYGVRKTWKELRRRGVDVGGEQVAMLRAAASSSDRVVCIVGHAGAGKTSALAALADAFQRDGFVAIGAAPSGVAAANLGAETGIPTGTLHRLLAEARRLGGLPRRCLLVVDEAGMADTRTLTRMLFQVDHAGGKSVLVGDPAQLSAVGPGGLFAAIVERQGAIELRDNHRQLDELERRALAVLRDGRSRDYLAHAAEHGRLIVAANRTEAKAQLVADWWQSARTELRGSAMIAYRRADVAELNTVARTLLDREGRLGRERLDLDNGIELAVGDRVLCTRNDRRLDVANGSRGTVAAIDRNRRSIVLELDDRRCLTLPDSYLDGGHISHAYALTGHKTQGLTVERAFVLADGQGALREWGYVALSRARDQTRLLVDRRRALQKKRTQAARELHGATRELAGMGAIGRARQGRRFREQLDERRDALARMDAELTRLDREHQTLGARLREISRAERPRPGRELSRERGLERGLELGL